MNAVYWLIIFVVLLVIELITMGLTTIWFAGGALVAFVAALLADNLVLELALFSVVSLVLLFVTRPIAVKWLNRDRVSTNVDSLIGQTAVVTKEISNLKGEGEVQVNGMPWTARLEDNDERELAAGTKVSILRVSGVKLIVEEKKED